VTSPSARENLALKSPPNAGWLSSYPRNLIAKCPAADLFGIKGRKWLAEESLPANELQALDALLRQLDSA
jgi:hypothetical protein